MDSIKKEANYFFVSLLFNAAENGTDLFFYAEDNKSAPLTLD